MKTTSISVALVVATLLFSSITFVASQKSYGPGECCFDFYSRRLRRANIVDFNMTHSLCPKEGVIIKMRSGLYFCVEPSQPWVEKLITAGNKAQTPSNVTSSDAENTN